MESVNLDVAITGLVNDEEMSGHGVAEYSPERNLIEGEMTFDHSVESFNELSISCSSIVSINCSLFSRAVDGASNLSTVLGTSIEGSVESTMLKTNGYSPGSEVVGEISQEFDLERNNAGEATGSTHLSGWYRGPLNIANSAGYLVYLHQADGGVEGVYGQRLLDESDRPVLDVMVRRFYTGSEVSQLPCDEIMIYKVLSVSRSTEPRKGRSPKVVVSFRSQAIYRPVLPA